MEDDLITPDDAEPLADDAEEDALDKLRGIEAGVRDPHIIGDAGPTDVPPGADPPGQAKPGGGGEAIP